MEIRIPIFKKVVILIFKWLASLCATGSFLEIQTQLHILRTHIRKKRNKSIHFLHNCMNVFWIYIEGLFLNIFSYLQIPFPTLRYKKKLYVRMPFLNFNLRKFQFIYKCIQRNFRIKLQCLIHRILILFAAMGLCNIINENLIQSLFNTSINDRKF